MFVRLQSLERNTLDAFSKKMIFATVALVPLLVSAEDYTKCGVETIDNGCVFTDGPGGDFFFTKCAPFVVPKCQASLFPSDCVEYSYVPRVDISASCQAYYTSAGCENGVGGEPVTLFVPSGYCETIPVQHGPPAP